MATIGDRVVNVQFMIGNRTDIDAKISFWLANAYIELASNVPFPDLEESDTLVMVVGTDSYDYPTNARGILACTLFFQTVPRPVTKKNIEYIDMYPITSPGTPVIWAPFHYKQVFRPVPDIAYNVVRRFWKKPVVNFTNTGTINSTIIRVPDDWLEILDYCAALRAFSDLQNTVEVQKLKMMLYGDPKHPQDNPGLIKERLTQIQAENMNSDYMMRQKTRRYTQS